MESKLQSTLNYALEELEEINKLSEKGKLTDKGVFVRMFCLGKVLTGWTDEGTELEQINRLVEANRVVMEILNKVSQVRAS